MTPAAKDVLTRAGKTFVQTLLPSVAYLSTHTHQLTYPVAASALLASSAATVSILWNGSTALLGARRAGQLATIAAAIEAAVAADRAARMTDLPPTSGATPVPPVLPSPYAPAEQVSGVVGLPPGGVH